MTEQTAQTERTPLTLVGETIEATRGEDGQLVVAEYHRTASSLEAIEEELHGLLFDVTTKDGMKDAKAARKRLVSLRTGLEKRRTEVKAPILAATKAIDGQAKALTERIKKLEDPIDQQIKAEEARAERERIAREEAERKRLSAIRERIETMRGAPAKHLNAAPDAIAAAMDELMADPLEGFEELAREAALVRDEAVARLFDQLEAAKQRESERAELEELRKFKEQQLEAQEEAKRREKEAETLRQDAQLQSDIDATRPATANAIPDGELSQAPRPDGMQNSGMTTPSGSANVGMDPGAGDDRTVEHVAHGYNVQQPQRSPVLASFLGKYGNVADTAAKSDKDDELRAQSIGDIWSAGAAIDHDVAELIFDAIASGKVAHVRYVPEQGES